MPNSASTWPATSKPISEALERQEPFVNSTLAQHAQHCWRGCSGTGRCVITVVSSASQRALVVVCRLMPHCGGDSGGGARVN